MEGLHLNLFWIKCRWTCLLGRDMVPAGVVSSSMVASQLARRSGAAKGRSVGSVQGLPAYPAMTSASLVVVETTRQGIKLL